MLIKAGALNEQNYYQLNDEIFNLRKKVFIHRDCDVDSSEKDTLFF